MKFELHYSAVIKLMDYLSVNYIKIKYVLAIILLYHIFYR